MDELTPHQMIENGQQAERILASPVYQAARELAKRSIFDEWEIADAPAVREALHAQLKALDRIDVELTTILTEGQLAAARTGGQ